MERYTLDDEDWGQGDDNDEALWGKKQLVTEKQEESFDQERVDVILELIDEDLEFNKNNSDCKNIDPIENKELLKLRDEIKKDRIKSAKKYEDDDIFNEEIERLVYIDTFGTTLTDIRNKPLSRIGYDAKNTMCYEKNALRTYYLGKILSKFALEDVKEGGISFAEIYNFDTLLTALKSIDKKMKVKGIRGPSSEEITYGQLYDEINSFTKEEKENIKKQTGILFSLKYLLNKGGYHEAKPLELNITKNSDFEQLILTYNDRLKKRDRINKEIAASLAAMARGQMDDNMEMLVVYKFENDAQIEDVLKDMINFTFFLL